MCALPIDIVVGCQTIRQDSRGTVTGVVFWRAGASSFPDDEWNDHIVIVTEWWVDAVARLVEGQSGSEMMDFMDGPYSIVCTVEDGSVVCKFVDRRSVMRVISSTTTTLNGLCATLYKAAKDVLRVCHEQELHSPEVETLRHSAERLRKGVL